MFIGEGWFCLYCKTQENNIGGWGKVLLPKKSWKCEWSVLILAESLNPWCSNISLRYPDKSPGKLVKFCWLTKSNIIKTNNGHFLQYLNQMSYRDKIKDYWYIALIGSAGVFARYLDASWLEPSWLVYFWLLLFSFAYFCLLLFTLIYFCLLLFTFVYFYSLLFTFVYFRLL